MIKLTSKAHSDSIDERERKLGHQTNVKELQMNIPMYPCDLNELYDASDRSGYLRNLQVALEQETVLDEDWRNRRQNLEGPRSQSLSPHG